MIENSKTFNLKDEFGNLFNRSAEFVSNAPGRVNLIGEHTDYNEGLVFPMAIDRKVEIGFSPRSDSLVNLYSFDFGQGYQFDLEDALEKDDVSWANYFKSIVAILRDSGYSLSGIDAVVHGNIPVASGLSSSAAIEVAAIQAMLTSAKIILPSPLEIAKLAQRSEREFIGVNCGLMDQFISAAACKDYALKIDCFNMEFEKVPIPDTLTIVVADTKLSRTLADSVYNERCTECAEAFGLLKSNLSGTHKLDSMRDVGLEVVNRGKSFLPEKLHKRLLHVVTENRRVELTSDALLRGDLETVGQLFNESHESLQCDYEVSSNGLDLITSMMRKIPGCFGARLTGAGFGGCAIAAVDSEKADEFIHHAERAYAELEQVPDFFRVVPSSGAEVLKLN